MVLSTGTCYAGSALGPDRRSRVWGKRPGLLKRVSPDYSFLDAGGLLSFLSACIATRPGKEESSRGLKSACFLVLKGQLHRLKSECLHFVAYPPETSTNSMIWILRRTVLKNVGS